MTLRMRYLLATLCISGCTIYSAALLLEQEADKLQKAESAARQAQAEQRQMEDRVEQLENELRKKNAELSGKAQALGEAQKKLAESLSSRGDLRPTPPMLEGFQVTWYNDDGVTKSGRHTEDGVTVAVDPAVIPLGTWIELVFPDGTKMTRRADDTGGAVHGRIIDVYAAASTEELLNRGRAYDVKVRILGKGAGTREEA